MSETEAYLARRLRRMRWFASGLLLAMGALFVAAGWLEPGHRGLGVVRAFAEAGMVGALADWFAVTALFRRPLGLPIPHTAIVPSRKDDIGRALARFVRDHFLIKEAVQRRLAQVDLAEILGRWLAREDSARIVSRDLGAVAGWLISSVDSAELRGALKRSFAEALEKIPVNTAAAALLEVLASGNHAQTLIDQLVRFGGEQLERNKDRIRARIHDKSPWWLPRFVDREIYDELVSEFERILGEIGENPEHEARTEFNRRLGALKVSLTEDRALIERSEALRKEILNHPAVGEYFEDVWRRLQAFLERSLADPQSAARLGVEREIRVVGERLQREPEVRRRLNGWLEALVTYLVETYRGPLSEIISETVERWDPSATSERIELHIGRDLQFIRINGTLVGGLVGVIIYTVWETFVG